MLDYGDYMLDLLETDRLQYRAKEFSSDVSPIGIRNALESGATGILSGVTDEAYEDIFYMLCFCLAVPQSKAVATHNAIETLRKRRFLQSELFFPELVSLLKGKVRFHNNKSRYLVLARHIFVNTLFWNELKDIYRDFCIHKSLADEQNQLGHDIFTFLCDRRLWLKNRFVGMGFKEASHFLRNVGMGGLAILDSHILKGLYARQLIPNLPKTLTTSNYLGIEKIMRDYAAQVGISIDELDLLLWSEKTGFVFK
jgi:N-glycosylase/DNA lyase